MTAATGPEEAPVDPVRAIPADLADALGANKAFRSGTSLPGSESATAVDFAADHVDRNAEFSLFYRQDYPRLVAFLIYLGAPLLRAQDLAQDAMTAAYQQWNDLGWG